MVEQGWSRRNLPTPGEQLRKTPNLDPSEVNFVLVDDTGAVADKGTMKIKKTRYGYESRFEKPLDVHSGDILLVDWEFDI